ncbi:hypothetical protein D3C79_954420 [compost metagenome]
MYRLMRKRIGAIQQRGRIKRAFLHPFTGQLQLIERRAAQRFAAVVQQEFHLLLHIIALLAADQRPHAHLLQFGIAHRHSGQPLQ